jgi:hypothetical protein
MTGIQLIVTILGLLALYVISSAWNDYQLAQTAQKKNELILAMSREETKRWEILSAAAYKPQDWIYEPKEQIVTCQSKQTT